MEYLLILKMFLFSLFVAFLVAKLEIEVEGKNGWAENLPTWKIKNKWTKLFLGNHPLTGYHTWLVALVIGCLHFPFVFGVPWSIALELQMFALFWVAVIAEDIFWFILNPYYGIRKLNKIDAVWHEEWFWFIPMLYIKQSAVVLISFTISIFLISN